MALQVREYGFDPPPRAPTERGRASLLVLAAAPPATLSSTTRIILHGTLLEGARVLELARDPGAPVPLLPPVPARDGRRLRDLLATRGVKAEVHPLGKFHRLRASFGSGAADVEAAIARAAAFLARAGAPEDEASGLSAVLREAAVNAAHHGNRDDAAKTARLDAVLAASLLTLTVEDEGEGFDHGALVAELARAGGDAVRRAEDRAAAGGRGGLGLLMIRRWADAVAWEHGGRRIRITKELRAR